MSEYRVLSSIVADASGPEVLAPSGDWESVHLRQGDLDGACGPCCLYMTLLIAGLFSREEVTALVRHKRSTTLGKIQAELELHPTLFRDGTTLSDLHGILTRSIGASRLQVEPHGGKGRELRHFILDHLDADHAVIVGLNQGSEYGHWVVAVGFQRHVGAEAREAKNLLVLDPGCGVSPVAAWNGVVSLSALPGRRLPYLWWAHDQMVQYSSALAVWAE